MMKKMNYANVVLYGAGFRGQQTFIELAKENIHVEAFCDRNAKRIIRHCGCDVYTLEEGVAKYKDFPFIVTIDNDKARNEVVKSLNELNIETYDSFTAFYQGKIDKEVKLTKCGEAAPYQIYSPQIKMDAIVYSFGIGFDYSFEIELVEKYGAIVYAFDPSPEVVEKMKDDTHERLTYYPYGIADKDEIKTFFKPRYTDNYSEIFSYWTSETEKIEFEVYRLDSLMKKLGHTHLDLLKMDVEGTEFAVLQDIVTQLDIDQICIETHARIFPNSAELMHNIKKMFNDNGYILVSNGLHEQTYIKSELMQ